MARWPRRLHRQGGFAPGNGRGGNRARGHRKAGRGVQHRARSAQQDRGHANSSRGEARGVKQRSAATPGGGRRRGLRHPAARQYRICNSIRPSGTIAHLAFSIPPSTPMAGISERSKVAFAATLKAPSANGGASSSGRVVHRSRLNRPKSRAIVGYPTKLVPPCSSLWNWSENSPGAATPCALFLAANKCQLGFSFSASSSKSPSREAALRERRRSGTQCPLPPACPDQLRGIN